MITFFCPNCWCEVQQDEKTCPYCQANIADVLEQRDYLTKLEDRS
jgi:RNA polymerase subunit RPABC4/transcription elongation factor Spt4